MIDEPVWTAAPPELTPGDNVDLVDTRADRHRPHRDFEVWNSPADEIRATARRGRGQPLAVSKGQQRRGQRLAPSGVYVSDGDERTRLAR
jgi:hypothetical protein